VAVIHLGRSSPDGSSDQLGIWNRRGPRRRVAPRSLFGLAPGGVCRAPPVTRRAVCSYHTVSPLPGHAVARAPGGLFSVALSFESPRLAVSQHPAQGARTFLGGANAPPRPPFDLQREARGV